MNRLATDEQLLIHLSLTTISLAGNRLQRNHQHLVKVYWTNPIVMDFHHLILNKLLNTAMFPVRKKGGNQFHRRDRYLRNHFHNFKLVKRKISKINFETWSLHD